MTKTYAEIRKIDVSQHIEKKGDLSYLSWAWAVDTLFMNDNDASWEYLEPATFPDGTVMVHCVVKAFGKERKAHLPVMDYKNQAIKNPGAFQMNTAMQRCLVKAIAHHGLGLYIYAGEDLPEGKDKVHEFTRFTREDKIFQRDFLYELALCTTKQAVDDLTADWFDELKEQPEAITGTLNDAIDARRAQIKDKITPPAIYQFVDVKEAIDFSKAAYEALEKEEDAYTWFLDSDHKLKAIDKTLKAEKYKKEGKTTYERLIDAYNEKFPESNH